jgi:hypothetical protein
MEKAEQLSVDAYEEDNEDNIDEYITELLSTPDYLLNQEEKECKEQFMALEEINKLDEPFRLEAHYLLTVKNRKTQEFRYSPKEVLRFINDIETEKV